MSNKIFVMADIHGAYKALLQVLERSGFDYEKDTLIQLGDVCDGWDEVYECVEELLKIKNLIAIKGNHDDWFCDYLQWGLQGANWLQGGIGTLKSYCDNLARNYFVKKSGYNTDMLPSDIPDEHRDFFINKQRLYYIDGKNRCFVHGGFDRHDYFESIEQLRPQSFYWDRDLWMAALSYGTLITNAGHKFKMKENFTEVFIGHTATVNWNQKGMYDDFGNLLPDDEIISYKTTPMVAANIINLDTGAGFKGKLTIMNVDTKEYWQSDRVDKLYDGQKGRN